jgi:hypothetical protein
VVDLPWIALFAPRPSAASGPVVKIRRITLVWVGLLAATARSWALGHESLPGDPRNPGVLILAIAFLKIRFGILDFMELRHATRRMRVAGEAWAFCASGALIALYRF